MTLEDPDGSHVHVELPWREHADVAPAPNPGACRRARLKDQRREVAGKRIGCGRQADRTGADDDDRQFRTHTRNRPFHSFRLRSRQLAVTTMRPETICYVTFSGISRSTIT